jgi:hypothetical protein
MQVGKDLKTCPAFKIHTPGYWDKHGEVTYTFLWYLKLEYRIHQNCEFMLKPTRYDDQIKIDQQVRDFYHGPGTIVKVREVQPLFTALLVKWELSQQETWVQMLSRYLQKNPILYNIPYLPHDTGTEKTLCHSPS